MEYGTKIYLKCQFVPFVPSLNKYRSGIQEVYTFLE